MAALIVLRVVLRAMAISIATTPLLPHWTCRESYRLCDMIAQAGSGPWTAG